MGITAMQIVSRAAALEMGQKTYFNGKPCPRGHVSERYVSNYECEICSRRRYADNSDTIKKRSRRWYYANPETVRNNRRAWKKANPEKRIAAKQRRRQRHLERFRAENRQWYASNAERWREIRRKNRENNPELHRAQRRRSYERHAEAHREKARLWRLNNLERARARSKAWFQNPENYRPINHRRRALKRAAAGKFTKKDIQALLIVQACLCAGPHCRTDISDGYTIDHVMPLSRGGSNWPDNLQLLCASCNSSKRDKTMEEWLAALTRRGLLPASVAA
jgi:hypothetical protein